MWILFNQSLEMVPVLKVPGKKANEEITLVSRFRRIKPDSSVGGINNTRVEGRGTRYTFSKKISNGIYATSYKRYAKKLYSANPA